MYWVYLLYSPKHDKYYVGYTGHLPLRFMQHNVLSTDSFTSKYRPWCLVLAIPCKDKKLATALERMLKNKKSKLFYQYWIKERAKQFIPASFSKLIEPS